MENVKFVFNDLATNWEKKHDFIENIYDGESERLISELKNYVEDGMVIADVGCGTGKVTKALLELNKNITIVAVDTSINMLNKLNEEIRDSNNVEIIQSSIEELQYCNKFDLILMQQLIHHLPDPTKGFINAKKLLKKNGKIIALVIGDKHMSDLFGFNKEYDSMGRFTKDKLENIACEAGLKIYDFFDDKFIMSFSNLDNYINFMDSVSLASKMNSYVKFGAIEKLRSNLEFIKDNKPFNVKGNHYTAIYVKEEAVIEHNNKTIEAYSMWSNNYSDVVLRKIIRRSYSYDDLAKKIKNIINCINKKDKKKVLEVGIGTGLIGSRIKKLDKNISLTGIDISKEMVNKIDGDDIYDEVVISDATNLPFIDKYFDCIYTTFMLHHSYSLNKILFEFNRVLKEDGILIIVDLMLDENEVIDAQAHSEIHEYGAGVNYYPLSRLKSVLLLKKFNLVDVRLIGDMKGLSHYMIIAKKE